MHMYMHALCLTYIRRADYSYWYHLLDFLSTTSRGVKTFAMRNCWSDESRKEMMCHKWWILTGWKRCPDSETVIRQSRIFFLPLFDIWSTLSWVMTWGNTLECRMRPRHTIIDSIIKLIHRELMLKWSAIEARCKVLTCDVICELPDWPMQRAHPSRVDANTGSFPLSWETLSLQESARGKCESKAL